MKRKVASTYLELEITYTLFCDILGKIALIVPSDTSQFGVYHEFKDGSTIFVAFSENLIEIYGKHSFYSLVVK